MTKLGEKAQFVHPLEPFAQAILAKQGHIDVWDLAPVLGRPTRPMAGVKAYEIVAQDILEVMASRGVLTRMGNKPRGVRPGRCFYELAQPV
jgi:hypothetical protein